MVNMSNIYILHVLRRDDTQSTLDYHGELWCRMTPDKLQLMSQCDKVYRRAGRTSDPMLLTGSLM